MIRTITSFAQDEVGDWVAFLSCFHSQHMRHRPLLENRPWVLIEALRNAKIGSAIDCISCDRHDVPPDMVRLSMNDLMPVDLREALNGHFGSDTEEAWIILVIIVGKLTLQYDQMPFENIFLAKGNAAAIPPGLTASLLSYEPETILQVQRWTVPHQTPWSPN